MTTTRYGIKENQVRAFNKMIRISHQKLNLVCDMVRGMPVERAQEVVPKPGKRNIFRHERRPPATGRIQNCITGKEWLIKVPVKQTVEKDPAWIQNSSAGERY